MLSNTRLFSALIFICCVSTALSQVTINEVIASNSYFFDSDGDSPDWIELHNLTDEPVILDGWTITDDLNNPQKWRFENTTIDRNQHLLLWASGKDRSNSQTPRTLIDAGDTWRYIIPDSTTDNSWIDKDFNDQLWLEGTSGFGYSDGDDTTEIPEESQSLFLRSSFIVSDIDKIQNILLNIDYDDSFVAYINGIEIARANIEGALPAYNDTALVAHEAKLYRGWDTEQFEISTNVIVEGQNTIAIQAHNFPSDSSDFTLIPYLSAYYDGLIMDGIRPPEILELSEISAHTNFKISSREDIYLFNDAGQEVSSLLLDDLPIDVSLGRRTTDDKIVLFEHPTPRKSNIGNGSTGFLDKQIIFSNDGGLVDSFELTLEGLDSFEIIRYTLDATLPNDSSSVYTQPIKIEKNTVVRARIYKDEFVPSKTESRCYIVGALHSLPIVSLITEPDNFFSADKGIIVLGEGDFVEPFLLGANIWEDWERPVHFSLFESDSTGIMFDGGTKIHGGTSRLKKQKSFKIFARKQYGEEEIRYPLFPKRSYDTYQSFLLRNSGSDFLNANMRDVILTSLMDGSGLETQSFRPVVTYINGEYWGFHHMREKINEHFLASISGVDSDKIDIVGPRGIMIHGSNLDFISLMQYLEDNRLIEDSLYQVVAQQVDIENTIKYLVAQMYFTNNDWPYINIKHWRTDEGKWRPILFDTDAGFGRFDTLNYQFDMLNFALDSNSTYYTNPPKSNILFRRLMENTTFKNNFINQFADELNSRFLPDKVQNHIDSISEIYDSEIVNHYTRWGTWTAGHQININRMKNFTGERPEYVKSHILEYFDLLEFHQIKLKIDDPKYGYIKINSLDIRDSIWVGDYFQDIPIRVTAVPKLGYKFSHWVGDSISTEAVIELNLQSQTLLIAVFEPDSVDRSIVINEINYKSSDVQDTGDWIELFNAGQTFADLSNWIITDGDIEDGFSIPESTIIESGEFVILARKLNDFNQFHELENVIGGLNFGISSDGELLKLFNHENQLIDTVAYLPYDPWPDLANGTGNTLELISPDLDNSKAENWKSINLYGSPGLINEESTSLLEVVESDKFAIYPNPSSDSIHFEFELKDRNRVNISIVDMKGYLISELVDEVLMPGHYQYYEMVNNLSTGKYIVKIHIGNQSSVYQWIKN